MAAETDEEQIEVLKNWWKENGNSLVITVVVALAAVFGYRAWENNVAQSAADASAMYEDLSGSLNSGPIDTLSTEVLASIRAIGDRLKTEHGDSAYAHFGALHLAKVAVDKGELEVAEAELRWMLDNDVSELLEPVARMRLARVLGAQERVDEALAVLDNAPGAAGYEASWDELRGDLLFQKGDAAAAHAAYQRAFNALPAGQTRPFLKMKLDDLSGQAAAS
ncbi:MAG: tetratricopeptide repeat protein [Proteobacteria bacterium]|nr:tetratricopeptide repeat protein [Pseudomonadota bacterium]MDA1302118.1 tetratricopeptide repeat protein [Pseudomonadota bacterium]